MRSVTTLRLGLPTEHALSTETDLHTDATPDVDLMTAPIVEPKTFAELGVHPKTVEALAEDGIITAFPIQELTLPLALAGNDLIGQAKTGTGKTLGFGIPALQRLIAPDDEGFDEQPSVAPVALAGIRVVGGYLARGIVGRVAAPERVRRHGHFQAHLVGI